MPRTEALRNFVSYLPKRIVQSVWTPRGNTDTAIKVQNIEAQNKTIPALTDLGDSIGTSTGGSATIGECELDAAAKNADGSQRGGGMENPMGD